MNRQASAQTSMPFTTQPDVSSSDDLRWRALLGRSYALLPDGAPDHFLYGVTSTGVVCRPACPSRRPMRTHVRFFDGLPDALAAGFRACRRCRPDSISPADELARRIDRTRRYIEAGASDKPLTLASLAQIAGISPFHLQRSFRASLGVSPAEYTRRVRTQRFAEALNSQTVTDAVYAAGFDSPRSVYGTRVAPLGMTPSARKRKGTGERIVYCISDSPLGRMLVATTEKGVCSIAFGNTDEQLLDGLQTCFAAAELILDDPALERYVREVLAHLHEPRGAITFPLHTRATAFQQRVWKALQTIPRGETRTYTQVAEVIGAPTAARAVARACATNPIAVAIPCHRVVGSTGALTGYRWGMERKKRLLQLERAQTIQE